MASETDTSTAGRSDPSTVSAAALRLDPLLRKMRDELLQYLEAFELAIHGARREDIQWPLFAVDVRDPGDGGTIAPVQQEAGDFVGVDNFAICRFNIPVSDADIETAASYLRRCRLDFDAQRLLEVFNRLKAAFCSVANSIPLSDGVMASRKFHAQELALVLSKHLEELIGTLPTILTGGVPGGRGVKSAAKRSRATKKDTQLKTIAAILHKIKTPEATEEQCAAAVDIPRTTLRDRREWKEWAPKIEAAARSGKVEAVKAIFDARMGEMIPTRDEPDDDE